MTTDTRPCDRGMYIELHAQIAIAAVAATRVRMPCDNTPPPEPEARYAITWGTNRAVLFVT